MKIHLIDAHLAKYSFFILSKYLVNKLDENGLAPLHRAARSSEYLFSKTNDGFNLFYSSKFLYYFIVELNGFIKFLTDNPHHDFNVRTFYGETALDLAIEAGNYKQNSP